MNENISLKDMMPGQQAVVKSLISSGSIRRRLLDIGLTEGTMVKCVGKSPAGDPSAFLIRGAVIAIRSCDSEKILVEPLGTEDKIIALAGNPNVGKSTVFNGLTGMRQHTGNWPGKTVSNARGRCNTENHSYVLVDIPGTYSLMAHSQEEEVARDFLQSGEADITVVVCDATCLERNLNLALQIMEICPRVVICVNLMDEAEKRHIKINFKLLSERMGVPVVGLTARKKHMLRDLMKTVDKALDEPNEPDESIKDFDLAIEERKKIRNSSTLGEREKEDKIVDSLIRTAEKICDGAVTYSHQNYDRRDRRLDKIFTSRLGGYPVMVLMLLLIFWLTISGANYPSELLAKGLFSLQEKISELFLLAGMPKWIHDMIVLGVYRVLAWVVSVMLPPMAIFFPLFTILEDLGYLPRIAYNLDKAFKCCGACGKQALTTCMGFGCNAVGVMGCRIIDSPRERMLAILTNSFVPCNGKFSALIAIITMFFVGAGGIASSVQSAVILTLFIVLGIAMTLVVTKVLSKTLLKGMPSSFTLELPPYRMPQFGKVIVRSILDRTIFVLGRAAAVAAPAGLVVWILANTMAGGMSLLDHIVAVLEPIGQFMGLDGAILTAFILGLPANEIIIPVIIMIYTSQGSLMEIGSIHEMQALFMENGWTLLTAICTMIFFLMHWPCATTLLTVKKETGSWKWTVLAAIIPALCGFAVCAAVAGMAGLLI